MFGQALLFIGKLIAESVIAEYVRKRFEKIKFKRKHKNKQP